MNDFTVIPDETGFTIINSEIKETYIVIPLPIDPSRKIKLKFRLIGEQWICCASKETMTDIQNSLREYKMNDTRTAWVRNIAAMHQKFGVNPVIRNLDKEKLKAFLEFRINFLHEELTEMRDADKAEDVVDALIDLCVVAIGTLDAFEINSDVAWERVHQANMSKEAGIKPERPNPLGLPDLIKPAGWTAPTHADNVGLLSKIFGE